MRKVSSLITGAVILLLVGMLAWSAEATSLTTVVGVEPGNPLVEQAVCSEADGSCDEGNQDMRKVLCPKMPSCPCKPGISCQRSDGIWCYCPN
jgi:hypothetical protein